VLLLPALGAAPLERAEVYFVDAARGMAESGDYLVPRYRGEPFFDKPALTYWLMAAAFEAFGASVGAARLVPVAATLLVLAATAWLGRTLLEPRAALAGTLVLATTPAFMGFGRIAMSDMLLALWSTLAVTLAARAWVDARAWPWIPLLGAALGLGFLTKGPVAVLLPALGVLALWWSRRRERVPVTAGAMAAAAALFVVLGLGWFYFVWMRLGAEPLRWFFLRENLQRFAGATYDAGRPPWYYLTTYLATGLPWSLFMPLAAWTAFRARTHDTAGTARTLRVLLAWAALMAVPLSLSRGKIDYYLLPLYPPLSLAVGAHLVRGPWSGRERTWARCVLVLCALLLAALPAAALRVPSDWLPSASWWLLVAAVPLLGALACAWAAWRPRPPAVLATLAGASATVFLAASAVLLPAFAAAQPHRALLADVQRERFYRPDAAVVVCEDEARVQREVLFHARVAVQEQCDLWAPASSPHPFLLLLRAPERQALSAVEGLREVGTYRYLPSSVLTLRGLLAGVRPAELTLVANYATTDPVAETRRKRERKRALRDVAETP
jgi:4-amino-4-deoxy-L-arabinose transferase-like glycosyltransferase